MSQSFRPFVCVVTAFAASAASAQYTDLPDTVIPLGGTVEIDLNADGVTDLIFRGHATDLGPRYTVETLPGIKVLGSVAGDDLTATALPPGVIIEGGSAQLDGSVLLISADKPNSDGLWAMNGVRFMGVGIGLRAGWVRIATSSGIDGPVLTILDFNGGEVLNTSTITLIDGFYAEQFCKGDVRELRVWMGGIWGDSCFPGPIEVEQSNDQLGFTAQVSIAPGQGCCNETQPWVQTVSIQLPATGVYSIESSVISWSGVTHIADHGLLLIGCCPADWNGDGQTDFFDIAAFLQNWKMSDTSVAADLNLDGQINFFDLAEFIALYNAGCP